MRSQCDNRVCLPKLHRYCCFLSSFCLPLGYLSLVCDTGRGHSLPSPLLPLSNRWLPLCKHSPTFAFFSVVWSYTSFHFPLVFVPAVFLMENPRTSPFYILVTATQIVPSSSLLHRELYCCSVDGYLGWSDEHFTPDNSSHDFEKFGISEILKD